jgi:hypothetical protein
VTDTFTAPGRADYILETQGTPNLFLDAIDRFMDGKNSERILKEDKEHALTADPPILPFFCSTLPVLQRWYGLS